MTTSDDALPWAGGFGWRRDTHAALPFSGGVAARLLEVVQVLDLDLAPRSASARVFGSLR